MINDYRTAENHEKYEKFLTTYYLMGRPFFVHLRKECKLNLNLILNLK